MKTEIAVFDVLKSQPALRPAYDAWCENDDDQAWARALEQYGFSLDSDGTIFED